MGRVLTNNFQLSVAREETIETLPTEPEFHLVEPNGIGAFGANITTVARSPISKLKQRRKGGITDLDSSVEYESDFILSDFIYFIPGFLFSKYADKPAVFTPTAVTSDGYTVAAGGDIPANTLVFTFGCLFPENNGFKVVGASSTATSVKTTGLKVETDLPTNATLSVCGVRGASGDLEINTDGDLTSTILDLTTLGLAPGHTFYIGGAADINKFANADDAGYVTVVMVEVHRIVLTGRSQDYTADAGTGKEIDLYFGRFLKNVETDDPAYVEYSHTFEGEFINLGNPTGDEYEYAKGNFCNSFGLDLPLTDKATVSYGFIGTDATEPKPDRAKNADTPIYPVQTTMFNTSADLARLRIQEVDETGLSTDFKSLTININSNVTPEKVLGKLGARFMNTGNFEIDMETQLLFVDGNVISAIRQNRTLTMDFAIRNTDGAVHFKIPSMTIGGGAREFPTNATVLINTTAQAFMDPILKASLCVSLFPYLP